jgi:hypothetical protein
MTRADMETKMFVLPVTGNRTSHSGSSSYDNDDDIYLYKSQMKISKNLYHTFLYRPARKA